MLGMTREFSSKVNELNFQMLLFTYDLIILTQCWLEKNYKKQFDGFDAYYFPRLKSRSTQGGGTVILIRY